MPKPNFSKRKEPDQQLSYRIKQQNLSQRDLPTSYSLPDITHGQEHNHPHCNQQAVRHGY